MAFLSFGLFFLSVNHRKKYIHQNYFKTMIYLTTFTLPICYLERIFIINN